MSRSLTLCFVVGARPNFPKVAPILSALKAYDNVRCVLVHTGQHYDPELSATFFEDLGISDPDVLLGVGSGSHAVQTAKVMVAFEEHCLADPPDGVIVLGDVNSTVACALVASKLHIPVAHVEAGLRSGDRTMPEELNRLVTDTLSNKLYTHCREADDNLASEGIDPSRVLMTGNVMIDTLLRLRGKATKPVIGGLPDALLAERGYGLVTLHRPALVDDKAKLTAMVAALAELSRELPLLYPMHPRSLARMVSFGLLDGAVVEAAGGGAVRFAGDDGDGGDGDGGDDGDGGGKASGGLWLCPPVRYLNFLWLMDHARLVLTDSGGIQEETTCLAVPCLTLRENTERAVTIVDGTNELVGLEPADALAAARRVLAKPMPDGRRVPELWDGGAGARIAADLVEWLG